MQEDDRAYTSCRRVWVDGVVEDDCTIERFWHNPKLCIGKLQKFRSIVGLDYNVCWDFPLPLKYYNHFRNSTCTYWLPPTKRPANGRKRGRKFYDRVYDRTLGIRKSCEKMISKGAETVEGWNDYSRL